MTVGLQAKADPDRRGERSNILIIPSPAALKNQYPENGKWQERVYDLKLESECFKLGCVRTRASKEAVARVGSVARGPLASNLLHLLI